MLLVAFLWKYARENALFSLEELEEEEEEGK